MDHYEMFLDIHNQLSKRTAHYFLEQAKCKPPNCEQYSWDHAVAFEGSYLDDVSESIISGKPQGYLLNVYMKTPEVRFLLFIEIISKSNYILD